MHELPSRHFSPRHLSAIDTEEKRKEDIHVPRGFEMSSDDTPTTYLKDYIEYPYDIENVRRQAFPAPLLVLSLSPTHRTLPRPKKKKKCSRHTTA